MVPNFPQPAEIACPYGQVIHQDAEDPRIAVLRHGTEQEGFAYTAYDLVSKLGLVFEKDGPLDNLADCIAVVIAALKRTILNRNPDRFNREVCVPALQ